MTFVDTSAWFASAVEEDINHSAASRWLEQKGDALVTSDSLSMKLLPCSERAISQQRH